MSSPDYYGQSPPHPEDGNPNDALSLDANKKLAWKPGGGGSTPGAAIVRGPFNFTHATPGLNNGVAFYTPTIGDVLLDAWIVIDTAFSGGTTPTGDIGPFTTDGNVGWYGNAVTAIDMTVADSSPFSASLLNQQNGNPSTATDLLQAALSQQLASAGALNTLYNAAPRQLPALFIAADPLLVVVSQNGHKGGTASGASAGAGRVYVITATPAAFS